MTVNNCDLLTCNYVSTGEMLGIQPRDDEGSITDLQRDIEAVLDTLLDEREKQVQQQGQPHGNSGSSQSSMDTYSRNSLNGTNIGNQPVSFLFDTLKRSSFIVSLCRIRRRITARLSWTSFCRSSRRRPSDFLIEYRPSLSRVNTVLGEKKTMIVIQQTKGLGIGPMSRLNH